MEKVAILPMPLYETNSGSLYSLLGLVEFLKNHDILSYTLFKTMNVSKEQKEFINRNFDCLSIEDISSKNDVSACIVGPEHIWHYDYTYKNYINYFLDFIKPNIKKIAYAASFGAGRFLGRDIDLCRAGLLLESFDFIGVRDLASQKILTDIFDCNSCLTCDPTLFLTENQLNEKKLEKIIIPGSTFYYFYNKKLFDDPLNFANDDYNPEEYIKRIISAEYIITDTLNVVLLSIVLHKKVLVVLKEGTKANHRITEFFSKVNLSTQKFYEVNTFNKNQDLDSLFIDFSKESLHDLDAYIDCSKNLLISALKTNVQQCKHKNSQKWLEQMSLIFGTYNRYFK